LVRDLEGYAGACIIMGVVDALKLFENPVAVWPGVEFDVPTRRFEFVVNTHFLRP